MELEYSDAKYTELEKYLFQPCQQYMDSSHIESSTSYPESSPGCNSPSRLLRVPFQLLRIHVQVARLRVNLHVARVNLQGARVHLLVYLSRTNLMGVESIFRRL